LFGRGVLWVINLLVAIAEKGGKIAVLVLAALFLLPSLYGTAVRWMPHSYYLVGALGKPPAFEDLPAWNIDLPAVDTGARFQRHERLIASLHAVVRLRGENKYIPGHTNPYEGAASPAGKEWERNTCLFVDDVVFVTRQRFAQTKTTGKGPRTALEITDAPYPFRIGNKPAPALRAVTASALLDETQDHLPASAAALLTAKLKAGGVPQQCQSDKPGEVCPRIQIWLYGVPAACSTGPPKI